MEAFGTYSVKVNENARFKLPKAYGFEPNEIVSIQASGNMAIIRDASDFHRVSSVFDPHLKRQIHTSHQPVSITKNGNISVPSRFKLDISFTSQKMIIWGKGHRCLLLTNEEFEKNLDNKKLALIEKSKQKILMLKEKRLLSLKTEDSPAVSVETKKYQTNLQIDFNGASFKKLYCILTNDGLAIYSQREIEALLGNMIHSEKEKLLDVIFTMSLSPSKTLNIPKEILELFTENNYASVIDTSYGIFITHPDNEKNYDRYENLYEVFSSSEKNANNLKLKM